MSLVVGDALYAFKTRLSDPNNVLDSWDPSLVTPCTWFHVTCDSNNYVTRLYSILTFLFFIKITYCHWVYDSNPNHLFEFQRLAPI